MSVFDFQKESGEQSTDNPDENSGEESMRTVSAVENTNGDGYSTIMATIPADFRDDLDISGGDILMMKHEEGSDEIRVSTV